MSTPDDLVAEYVQLDAYVDKETKRFSDHIKPTKARMEAIKNELLAMMIEQKTDFKTEHGTAYRSTITTPKIENKDVFLDWVLEDWDNRGALLQIGAPQIDAFRDYVDARRAEQATTITPPGTTVSYFTRVNIRSS
jgi:hypothetical protein